MKKKLLKMVKSILISTKEKQTNKTEIPSYQKTKPLEFSYSGNYAYKYEATYIYDECVCSLGFKTGKYLDLSKKGLKTYMGKEVEFPYQFKFCIDTKKGFEEGFRKYDFIASTEGAVIVSPKALSVLEEFCPNDFQKIPTEIETADGIVNDYHIINILQGFDLIDMEKSVLRYFDDDENAFFLDQLYFKENPMQKHHLAIDMRNNTLIAFSRDLVKELKKQKCRGMRFIEDYDAYKGWDYRNQNRV